MVGQFGEQRHAHEHLGSGDELDGRIKCAGGRAEFLDCAGARHRRALVREEAPSLMAYARLDSPLRNLTLSMRGYPDGSWSRERTFRGYPDGHSREGLHC